MSDVVSGLKVRRTLGVLLKEGDVVGLEVGICCGCSECLFDDLGDLCWKGLGNFRDCIRSAKCVRETGSVLTHLTEAHALFVQCGIFRIDLARRFKTLQCQQVLLYIVVSI
jgi:hypothetical protein